MARDGTLWKKHYGKCSPWAHLFGHFWGGLGTARRQAIGGSPRQGEALDLKP